MYAGLPWWLSSKELACQCSRHRFHPWVRRIPWRRKWLRTIVFLPEKSHGQRSLEGYGLGGCKRQTYFSDNNNTRLFVNIWQRGNSASRNRHWWWCSMPRAIMWRRLWGERFLPGSCPDVLICLSVVSAGEVKCFDFLLGRLNPNMLWKKWALDFSNLFSYSVVSNSLQPHALQHPRLPWPSRSQPVSSVKFSFESQVASSLHFLQGDMVASSTLLIR